MEICEEISLPSFSEKCCCQHFSSDSRLIIPAALAGISFFRVVLIYWKKAMHLVGTVLKSDVELNNSSRLKFVLDSAHVKCDV